MTNKELAAKCLIEAAELLSSTYDYDEEVLTENAKFSFFPKFKRLTKKYPELKEAEGLMKDINNELLDIGEVPTSNQFKNLLKLLLKLFKYMNSIASVILLPFCIAIVPIIPYTISRLVIYVEEFGYDALTKSELKKQIEALNKVIGKINDKNQKEKLKAQLDKLIELYKKLEK